MINPESLAKSGTEHGHQAAYFCWINNELFAGGDIRMKWIHAIANGGARGDSAKTRAIRGGQMKAEGVKKGVSDIFIPVPIAQWHGLYIEMKKPSEKPKRDGQGGVSEEQHEFGDYVKSVAFGFVVCYSWIEAKEVTEAYLNYKVQ